MNYRAHPPHVRAIFVAIALSLMLLPMQAQVLVNESWSARFASPSGAGWSASAIGETGENLEAVMPAGLANCESPRLAISLLVRSENPVSANETERPDWRLFPNPTSGEITLEGIATGYLDVRLFSINGQQLAQLFQGNYQGSSTLELKIPDIPPGIYVCRIQSGREFFSKKLIKH